MKYIVVELQTDANGTVANLVTQHETKDEAYSKYHQVLSYAAVSELPIHAAVLMDNTGFFYAQQRFEHGGRE